LGNARFDGKIAAILEDFASDDPGHHLGRPFVTAYQLAIEFDRRHGDIVKKLGYQVGGSGIGEHRSLAQYIALQLSQGIKTKRLADIIDGALISQRDVQSMRFSTGLESSVNGAAGMAMYRLKVKQSP
jgi:hypothetical protein